MNESYRSENEEEFFGQDADATQTVSEMLRNAREEQGLSQKDVADHLFLSTTFIRYIDDGEFDKLPKQPFIKGYLRSYARMVNLSGDEVVACYQKGVDEAEETVDPYDAIEESLGPNNFTGPVLQTGVAGLVGLVVIIAVVWWLVSGDSPEEPSPEATSPEVVVESPPVTSTDEKQVNQDDSEEADVGPVEITAGGLTSPASVEQEAGAGTDEIAESDEVDEIDEAAEVDEPGPQEASAATINDVPSNEVEIETVTESGTNYITVDAGGNDQLEFSFTDECWVEVQDAQGASIYADLNSEGDVLKISGNSPFEILLGRATSVDLYFNEEKVDLDQHVTSNNTARVSLGN